MRIMIASGQHAKRTTYKNPIEIFRSNKKEKCNNKNFPNKTFERPSKFVYKKTIYVSHDRLTVRKPCV